MIFEMAAFTSAYSNYRYADIYYNQKTEAFLDGHANFFEHLGGIYSQIVYDNTRVAVANFVGKNEKKPTDALLKLSMYYGFCFRFCANYSPHQKGHVEKSVEYIRRKVFSSRDEFDSYEEARAYLKHRLQELNARPQSLQNDRTAIEMLDVEKAHLLPKPPKYDSARIAELKGQQIQLREYRQLLLLEFPIILWASLSFPRSIPIRSSATMMGI